MATELGGQTLTAGVYDSSSGTFEITGDLTLDAQGDPDAVFIFQTESTLITASASRVVLINGAQACNVFWQVGSSATLGTNSRFVGNILALTSITANTGATVDGRLLARNGAVTLDTNVIRTSECEEENGDGDNGDGDNGDGDGDSDNGDSDNGERDGGDGDGDGDNGDGDGDGDGGEDDGANGDGDGDGDGGEDDGANGGGDGRDGANGGGVNGDGVNGDGADGGRVNGADENAVATFGDDAGAAVGQGGSDGLPLTGGDIRLPILLGILLLLFGAGLIRIVRPPLKP